MLANVMNRVKEIEGKRNGRKEKFVVSGSTLVVDFAQKIPGNL
jgi:hypothetical protein